ncbi:cytochrome c oxidase subunit [Lynx pardinus]|uniref:Cytochrome c oxidase subunit 5B, mitochondrial n=1 Tax=Lynx pardinus TaxID=191816 RepID=A0A485MU58_LYNPA|nr:cytochrome c oxidase subunit [Lynx pardinus]
MASRLLRGVGSLAAQALRVRGPNGVAAVRSMASGGGVPTDDEQATGLEREVMMAARKGLDPYNMLAPKAASGTKEDPNLVPSITNKRIVGCICKYLTTIFLSICLIYPIQDVSNMFQVFCVYVVCKGDTCVNKLF